MADYTVGQLKGALENAGASGAALDVATAISLAEDTGRSLTASNTAGNSAGVDRGPFQINSYYHPDVSTACADDLTCAAQAMARISNNFTNFRPWSTFNSGAYLKFLPQVQGVSPDASSGAGATLASLTSSIPGAGVVSGIAGDIVDAVKRSLLAAVFVAGGLGLVVMGIWRGVAPIRNKAKELQGQATQAASLAAVAAA